MIAFEVKKNGKRVALAGREDLYDLHVIVEAIGKLGIKSPRNITTYKNSGLRLHIDGLGRDIAKKHDNGFNWSPRLPLKIGDEITIKILRTKVVDRHKKTYVWYRVAEDQEKEIFEHCREFYFKFRDKYE